MDHIHWTQLLPKVAAVFRTIWRKEEGKGRVGIRRTKYNRTGGGDGSRGGRGIECGGTETKTK